MARPLLLFLASLAATFLLAGDRGSSPPALATSPPSAQRFAIDTHPGFIPANTPTSVGSIEPRASINFNGVLDADEALVDTVEFDVAAIGIPAANPLRGYQYTLFYNSGLLQITYHQAKLGTVLPGSTPNITTDPLPDTDGSFSVAFDDTGGPGTEESGSGVLDTLRVQAVAAGPVLLPLTLDAASHTDPAGGVHVPDALWSGIICIDTPCGNPIDVKMVSQTVSFPAVIPQGTNTSMSLDRVIHNNGSAGFLGGSITATFTLPGGCTVNGQSGNPSIVSPVGTMAMSTPVTNQTSATVMCLFPTGNQISVKSCIAPGPSQVDATPSNNCDTDVVTFAMDDTDGDGWTDVDESGSPLCGDSSNEDSADDADVDDGCPGGPPQSGIFSEALFNIGTNPNDYCGNDGNPADLSGTNNKVDISDLTSFLAPARHYNTSPGDEAFASRWDLVPGRGTFTSWINITDITRLIVVKPPVYNGTIRWFGGPACQ